MSTASPPIPQRPAQRPSPPFPPDWAGGRPRGVFLKGAHGTLLVAAGVLAVAIIALLDRGSDSLLSFSILYLLPVAACAWSGGFPHGILVSLAGSVAWHLVDWSEDPSLPPSIRAWNGVIRFGTLVLMSSLVSRLRVSILRERLLARTDSLTGAANGRTFYETAASEADRARRTERPITLAYFDLDHFKKLNDRLGHAVGDQALRCVVQTIQLHLRSSDLLARLGGDEFALLLPETGEEGAAALLARVQEQLTREMGRKGWPVTLSVGAVTFPRPPADIDLMIQRVDALMYGAKRKGKGRIEHVVAGDPDTDTRPLIDRRATARALSTRTARVRREGREDKEQFAAVRDVSAGGIALHLETWMPPDAVLVVDSLAPGARTLLARVLHAVPEDGGWRHGCELSTRLSAEELLFWMGEETREGAAEVGTPKG